MSLPMFGPVLMPETTRRGRSGARPRKPSATQSEGEPSLENAARRVPGSLISVTRSGRSSVLVCPAAVQLRFGAMTHTSSTLLSALASALSPAESTPSSLVTSINRVRPSLAALLPNKRNQSVPNLLAILGVSGQLLRKKPLFGQKSHDDDGSHGHEHEQSPPRSEPKRRAEKHHQRAGVHWMTHK